MVPADAPLGGDPIAIVPLMHRHEVEPADVLTHTKMRHGGNARPHARPADRHRPVLRRLLPRRLRDDPGRAARPAGHRRRPGRRSGGRQRPAPLGRHRPAPPPLRRPDRRRARGRLRGARDGRGLDPQRRARGRLSGRDPAGRRIDGRLPRRPRQEGAPRDPTQGPPGGGGRRGPARRLRRIRSPTSRRSSTSTRRSGASTACSRRRRVAPRAGSCSAACSSSTAGRPAAPDLPVRRRPADRLRDPLRDRRGLPLLQRRRRPRRPRPLARRPDGLRATSQRALATGMPAARLPPRRRGVQVRVGRHGRADPAAARPAPGRLA